MPRGSQANCCVTSVVVHVLFKCRFFQKFGFVVDNVFDVDKNDRDVQREKFSKFLKSFYDTLNTKG